MIECLDTFQEIRVLPPESDSDWAALQVIPVDVERVVVRGAAAVMIVVVGLTDTDKAVAGSCTVQVVQESMANDGRKLVVAAAADTGISYGAGVRCPLHGARVVAVRVAAPTGAPKTLRIYMRRAT